MLTLRHSLPTTLPLTPAFWAASFAGPVCQVQPILSLTHSLWRDAGYLISAATGLIISRTLGLDPSEAHRALADSLRVKAIWIFLDGTAEVANNLVSYKMYDPTDSEPTPEGWEPLIRAASRGLVVRIAYDGGTRGMAPRSITPRRFIQRGGASYLVAFCHLDAFEKSFRLDRIRGIEIASEPELAQGSG